MQTAGMKTRSTMDNVIWSQNVKRSQNTYLIFADAEKCFDKSLPNINGRDRVQ